MTTTRAWRWATVAVCSWAAASIATRRTWTVSHTIDRTHHLHPAVPYAVWAALGLVGLWHAHDMATNRRGDSK